MSLETQPGTETGTETSAQVSVAVLTTGRLWPGLLPEHLGVSAHLISRHASHDTLVWD